MLPDSTPEWRGKLSLPTGSAWDALRTQLVEVLPLIYSLDILTRGDRAIVRGKVYSQEVAECVLNLVALHAPTVGFVDELTWESPLYSADEGDIDEEFVWPGALTGAIADNSIAPGSDSLSQSDNANEWSVAQEIGREHSTFEQVDRHPTIRPIGEAVFGQRLEIMVDLATEIDANTVGSFSMSAAAGWSRLEIDVLIDCDGLDILPASRRKVVSIYSDGGSEPALFSGIVTDDEEIEVRLHFTYNGRDCGYAERSVDVTSGSAKAATAVPDSVNYLSVDPSASGPHLTVRIHAEDEGGRCNWYFDVSPELRGRVAADEYGTTNLPGSAREYFEAQFAECPTLTPGRHVQKLRGIGETIWRAAPRELHDLYVQIRNIVGPRFSIQLITNEPHVPWELMFPDDPRVADPKHLFSAHPIARWYAKSGARVLNFPRGRRVSYIPVYDGSDFLPATKKEGEWLVSRLQAELGNATYAGFGEFLRQRQTPPVQLVHFSGHGAAPMGASRHGLRFTDDWVSVDEINGSVLLGKEHRSFFALNACQVGRSASALGSVSGWPRALTSRGFGGVMAPLWSIEDTEAASFIQRFLTAFMIDGQPLGEAARIAREEFETVSANAHAYIFYGDVMARAEA